MDGFLSRRWFCRRSSHKTPHIALLHDDRGHRLQPPPEHGHMGRVLVTVATPGLPQGGPGEQEPSERGGAAGSAAGRSTGSSIRRGTKCARHGERGKLGQRPHRIFGYLLHTTMMPCDPCITTNTTPPTKPPHTQYNRQSRHVLIASTLQSSDIHATPVTGCSGSAMRGGGVAR